LQFVTAVFVLVLGSCSSQRLELFKGITEVVNFNKKRHKSQTCAIGGFAVFVSKLLPKLAFIRT